MTSCWPATTATGRHTPARTSSSSARATPAPSSPSTSSSTGLRAYGWPSAPCRTSCAATPGRMPRSTRHRRAPSAHRPRRPGRAGRGAHPDPGPVGAGTAAPDTGLLTRVERDNAIPVQDVGIIDAIRSGTVVPVAALREFDGDSVVLADGTRLQPDLVVLATGYAQGLEPLIGHLGVLDDKGRPVERGGRTARGAKGLWFTGYTNPISGCCGRSRSMPARSPSPCPAQAPGGQGPSQGRPDRVTPRPRILLRFREQLPSLRRIGPGAFLSELAPFSREEVPSLRRIGPGAFLSELAPDSGAGCEWAPDCL